MTLQACIKLTVVLGKRQSRNKTSYLCGKQRSPYSTVPWERRNVRKDSGPPVGPKHTVQYSGMVNSYVPSLSNFHSPAYCCPGTWRGAHFVSHGWPCRRRCSTHERTEVSPPNVHLRDGSRPRRSDPAAPEIRVERSSQYCSAYIIAT